VKLVIISSIVPFISVLIFYFFMLLEQNLAMFEKEQGNTRQTAVYGHLQPFLAHPIPLAIGSHKKQNGHLDQKHFMGVKLTAVPIIRVVRSPKKQVKKEI